MVTVLPKLPITMNKLQRSFFEPCGHLTAGIILCFVFCNFFLSTLAAQRMNWTQLPPLPDKEGFAGMFAGVSGDALIIAGGANFPDKRPWEGGIKTWYDSVWMLASPDAEWKIIGKLPKPLGYGVSVTFGDEVICIGGSNAEGHHAECFAIQWKDGLLHTRNLPSLPQPCANMSGALVGSILYVAGGIRKPDALSAESTFWSMDLAQVHPSWTALPTWPGKERMLAVAGADAERFYIFSGAALHADKDGKPEREWLKDAYRYSPRAGWEKLPDMPRIAVAAPSPAMLIDAHSLMLASGDDGSKVGFKPETEHPGFPRTALVFDSVTAIWKEGGPLPLSRATVPTTFWRGSFVIPNGEARPGYRTNEVWSFLTK
jgi:N-acetylneuraminate epimerase